MTAFAAGFLLAWILRGLIKWRLRQIGCRSSNPSLPGRKSAPQVRPSAPGMRREWIWSPSQMAECGGPCWEAQDPRRCNCGALWRDVPIPPDPWEAK